MNAPVAANYGPHVPELWIFALETVPPSVTPTELGLVLQFEKRLKCGIVRKWFDTGGHLSSGIIDLEPAEEEVIESKI